MSEAIAVRQSAAIKKLEAQLHPELMPKADDIAGLEKFALDMLALHDAYQGVEAQANERKTLAGAYMHKARTLQGWKPGKIVDETGLSNSSVSRYALIAELHFDHNFGPEDPEWPTLTNELVTAKGFGPLMHPKKGAPPVQKSAILEAVENWKSSPDPKHRSIAPAAIAPAPAADPVVPRQTAGQNGPTVPTKTDGKIELFETLLASLIPNSPVSWVTLHGLVATAQAVLDQSPYKADGLERLAILEAKNDSASE